MTVSFFRFSRGGGYGGLTENNTDFSPFARGFLYFENLSLTSKEAADLPWKLARMLNFNLIRLCFVQTSRANRNERTRLNRVARKALQKYNTHTRTIDLTSSLITRHLHQRHSDRGTRITRLKTNFYCEKL